MRKAGAVESEGSGGGESSEGRGFMVLRFVTALAAPASVPAAAVNV
jgi:hypothetical protein